MNARRGGRGFRRIALWGGAIALVGATAVATGAIPNPDGSVDACIAKADRSSKTGLLGPTVTLDRRGTLRAIDTAAGQECAADEQPLSWNVKGEQGDPGEPASKLWVVVQGNGEVLAESGVESVTRIEPSPTNPNHHYWVVFDRDVSHCAAIPSAGTLHGEVAQDLSATTTRNASGHTGNVFVYLRHSPVAARLVTSAWRCSASRMRPQ
jgi:hypothetical protein